MVLERAKAKKRTVIYSDTGRGDASSFKNYKPAPKAYSTNTSDGSFMNYSFSILRLLCHCFIISATCGFSGILYDYTPCESPAPKIGAQ